MKKQLIIKASSVDQIVDIEVPDQAISTTVTPAATIPNQPPVVSVGQNQSITLPVNSVTLKGTASDLDGSIVSSVWSKVSGPSAGLIAEPNNLQTAVSGLIAGNYIYRLVVTDDKGASVSKDTTVTVNAEIVTQPGTPIPFTPVQLTTDFNRNSVDQWHGGWDVNIYSGTIGPDKYHRFQSHEIATNTKGAYDFTLLDSKIHEVIDRGGKLKFGIMTCFTGPDENSKNKFDGGYGSFPSFLHAEMQASPQKNWRGPDGCWVTNWNSEIYLSWVAQMNKDVYNHLNTTTYKGILLKNAIQCIDIRCYGNYGEWHTGGIEGAPAATANSLRRIIDAHVQAYPDIRLVAMIAGLDGGATFIPLFPQFPEISYYLLTGTNQVGEFGWRRDSLGSDEEYYPRLLENNRIVYNGMALKTLIMNKWKKAPIVGEPNSGVHMDLLPAQVRTYHMSSFGNGNYNVTLTSNDISKVKEAAKAAGHWLTITSGNITGNTITINWSNIQAGIDEDYEIWFMVKSGSSVNQFGKSSFNPRMFTGTKQVTDSFSSIPAGSLYVIIKDPKGNRIPLAIAISGRQSDGSYLLK